MMPEDEMKSIVPALMRFTAAPERSMVPSSFILIIDETVAAGLLNTILSTLTSILALAAPADRVAMTVPASSVKKGLLVSNAIPPEATSHSTVAPL